EAELRLRGVVELGVVVPEVEAVGERSPGRPARAGSPRRSAGPRSRSRSPRRGAGPRAAARAVRGPSGGTVATARAGRDEEGEGGRQQAWIDHGGLQGIIWVSATLGGVTA